MSVLRDRYLVQGIWPLTMPNDKSKSIQRWWIRDMMGKDIRSGKLYIDRTMYPNGKTVGAAMLSNIKLPTALSPRTVCYINMTMKL